MAEMNPLRRRMIEDMQVRNLSPVTQRCYVHAVAKFARHFNRSPDRLGLEEVRAYQIHLTTTGISWAGFNVAVCALRFLYGVTLGRTAMVERIPYARKRAATARNPERRRDRAVFRGRAEPEASHRADDRLCRRAARIGSGAAETRRHRQQSHADPGRTGQGRPRPLHHAVAAAARRAAHLLAEITAGALAVSRARTKAGRSIQAHSRPPAALLARRRSSESRSPSTRCATALPPICSKPAPTSALSRCCSAIATCRRQPAIRRSPPPRSATRPARSTG